MSGLYPMVRRVRRPLILVDDDAGPPPPLPASAAAPPPEAPEGERKGEPVAARAKNGGGNGRERKH